MSSNLGVKNTTILIVEDDEDIGRNLQTLLQLTGYSPVLVQHGKAALDYLRGTESLPAFILLDLTMPVMDGFEFRTHQEQDPKFGHVPVVIMTADGNAALKRQRLRADDFIRKPADVQMFLTMAKRYCG
jgi:CheY-like chemotaxis protein